MTLLKDILTEVLSKEKVHVTFPNLKLDAKEIVEMECYWTLQKIKAVIENDSLSDAECFLRIEEIVCAFEEMGSKVSGRHDFG